MLVKQDNKDIEKKIIVIDSQEGNIRVPDADTLEELIYSLENLNHKYFVIEL